MEGPAGRGGQHSTQPHTTPRLKSTPHLDAQLVLLALRHAAEVERRQQVDVAEAGGGERREVAQPRGRQRGQVVIASAGTAAALLLAIRLLLLLPLRRLLPSRRRLGRRRAGRRSRRLGRARRAHRARVKREVLAAQRHGHLLVRGGKVADVELIDARIRPRRRRRRRVAAPAGRRQVGGVHVGNYKRARAVGGERAAVGVDRLDRLEAICRGGEDGEAVGVVAVGGGWCCDVWFIVVLLWRMRERCQAKEAA